MYLNKAFKVSKEIVISKLDIYRIASEVYSIYSLVKCIFSFYIMKYITYASFSRNDYRFFIKFKSIMFFDVF